MENKIIIRKEDYFQSLEEENIDKLKVTYHRTSFSTYDPYRKYLHIQVGDYNEFNLFLEIDEYQMEKLIVQLQEQLKQVRYNY